jgi:hypothetical protein
VSDEERKATDEGKDEGEDVEAHKRHHGSLQDEGKQEDTDDSDDVEAHRRHHGA